ncbi:MAG TPA: multicopper oxidase family protein [Chitinophagaceae bacterium]|jgi:FtsP/CotA-like multicopper oxidase with cupredoxin domain|nr:multicopper oxidase family protein [Chitinophagaceae bacterium]
MKLQNQTVEYNLTASKFQWDTAPGKTITAWGFNNQIPAPTLKARVGDTMIIRVKNELQEPTIIHWHGLRIPSSMDGTGVVQEPIKPGETFEYRFQLPDAGTFWFHSHANETVQMERGMYGALIVEDPAEQVTTDAEKIFMIDDMKLDAKNRFTKSSWFFPRIKERHDGRQGNTLLINGKENPVIDVYCGQRERWRFINSSSARYFYLYMGGRPFQIIGTDGGLLESPITVNKILLTPGERIDVIAGPFYEGENFLIESLAYNRMTFLKSKRQAFATVQVGKERSSVANIPEKLREIEPLAPQDAVVTRKIKFSVGPSLKNGMNFLINNKIHVDDKPVKAGELQIWEIRNTSLMDHPFHLHGDFFQVIEENGKTPEYRAWKDTYNLTPRSKIKIAWLPDNRFGMWMYHCHILEHHEAGMMANFEVIDGSKDASQHAEHLHHVHRH